MIRDILGRLGTIDPPLRSEQQAAHLSTRRFRRRAEKCVQYFMPDLDRHRVPIPEREA
jgi:hypothetical protein